MKIKTEYMEYTEQLEKIALKLVSQNLKNRQFNIIEFLGVLIYESDLYDVLSLSRKTSEGIEIDHVFCWVNIKNEKKSFLSFSLKMLI